MQKTYDSSRRQICNKKKVFNILIVDDDIIASDMFKSVLESRGHHVVSLNEGVSCISDCKNNTYDIIFMDYHVGDIDGLTLTDFIKDIYKSTSIIFAYTGDTSDDAIKNFRKIGMNGVLVKPIDSNLIDGVMNTLEERGCVDRNIFSRLARRSNGSLVVF